MFTKYIQMVYTMYDVPTVYAVPQCLRFVLYIYYIYICIFVICNC